jgi:pimeloyl-ACP methyl ester carboxylesterase
MIAAAVTTARKGIGLARTGTPESTTKHVTSADGSRVGFEVVGDGPPVLLVHGTAADRTQWAPMAGPLGARFTVHILDRRGRGLSAEEADGSYALDREAEDLAAVVSSLGARPFVFSHSYGGLCTLKALADGVEFERVCIDESPAGMPGPPMVPEPVVDGLAEALDRGGPDGALEFFLRNVVGLQDEQIGGMRHAPVWQARTATIHTVVREARSANSYARESDRLAQVDAPVRFIVGAESPPPMKGAMEAAHGDIPDSELLRVEGRLFTTMYADPAKVAQELGDWFLGASR